MKRYRIEKDGTKTLISSDPLQLSTDDRIIVLDQQIRRVKTPDGRTKKIITRRLQRPSTPTNETSLQFVQYLRDSKIEANG